MRQGREEEAGRGKGMWGVEVWARGGEGGSGEWIAATFRFCCPRVGYTFGVLAFLRSLRGWGPGLWEEREWGREWEVEIH